MCAARSLPTGNPNPHPNPHPTLALALTQTLTLTLTLTLTSPRRTLKAGGSSAWTVISDARIKEVVGDFPLGVEQATC